MALTHKLNRRDGTRLTRGYDSVAMDRDEVRFLVTGITVADEEHPVEYEAAIEAAVAELGGPSHTSPWFSNDDGPPIHHVSASTFGARKIMGTVVYARGSTDCKPGGARSTLGFIHLRGSQAAAVEEISSGGPCDVEGITLPNLQARRQAIEHLSVRCVWSSATGGRPDPTLSGSGYRNTINEEPFTIDGIEYPAYTLRFDGFSYDNVEQRGGAMKYPGSINWSFLEGGWISHELICVRWVYEEGDDSPGTFPSMILQMEVQQRYLYPATDFNDALALHEICPDCFDHPSSS